MSLLAQLRGQGLHLKADGGKLLVQPRTAITDAVSATIRVNKATILRELAAISTARDAAGLEEWRAPLVLGRLHLCGNCARHTFGADPGGLGTCAVHGEGLVAFAMPFHCPEFQASKAPSAPEYLQGCAP